MRRGLSRMPADGITLPPTKGGLRHVPLDRLEGQATSIAPPGGRGRCRLLAIAPVRRSTTFGSSRWQSGPATHMARSTQMTQSGDRRGLVGHSIWPMLEYD